MIQRLEAQGLGGTSWSDYQWDDGSDHDDIKRITIRYGFRGIQYIWCDYVTSGKSQQITYCGKPWQGVSQTIEIDHVNGEQLVSVEGYCDSKMGIQGIQFKTNQRIFELMGLTSNCTKFSLSIEGKKIIGFHGTTVYNLHSLGAYLTWITPTRLEVKGGHGGKEWSDGGNYEGITKIYVGGGRKGIQYIKFDYVKNGQHIDKPAHGVKGGFEHVFDIDHLGMEYLVSVEGYYEPNGVIQGLKFYTNLKNSGLIGYADGKKFGLAAYGKKIIGFHGYAEKNLNSLGAYVTDSPIIKLGPKGITEGTPWDDGTFEGIRKVYIRYGDQVWGVGFDYDNKGEMKRLQHGQLYDQEGEFEVDYPNEFITSVEGSLFINDNNEVYGIASLGFKTSKGRTSPTFGPATKNSFLLESKNCVVVGFHGIATPGLFGIGAYFRHLPLPPDQEKIEAEGGDGGDSWDDGGFDGVCKICIGRSENAIVLVKFLYFNAPQFALGDDHGKKSPLYVYKEVELNWPIEFITSVEGSYDNKTGAITMLRFKTDKQTIPDFGLSKRTDSSFVLEKVGHVIVGFHGKSSNMLLHKIGVHVKPKLP